MEHGLILALAWGGGTLIVLTLIRLVFSLMSNPFDELDEEEIKEFDEAGSNISNLGGNIDLFK